MGQVTARGGGQERGSPETGFLWSLLRAVRRINEIAVMLVFAALCIVLMLQVFARFILNDPFSWSEELARYLQVWLVLLGAAICMQRGTHISIDYITSQLPPMLERGLAILMNLVVIGYLLVIVRFSAELVEAASFQTTPAMQIPMWAVYISIPIGGVLLLVESLVTLLRRLHGREPYERLAREEVLG
jgi:TRAP-type C4-dicarboxylate transport system permease small subunit